MKISSVRWRHVLPFMKAIPISFSDQPYLPGKHKGKRTIYTEPPLLKKARREARRRWSHSKYQSRLQLRLRSPRLWQPSLQRQTPSPLHQQRSTPWKMPSWPSQFSLRQPRQKAESSKDRDTPVSDRISFKRLFGDSISDSEEDEDTLRSPDISIHEPPVTSTPKRLVTSETVREYDVVDKAAQTDTYIAIPHGSRSRRTVIRDI